MIDAGGWLADMIASGRIGAGDMVGAALGRVTQVSPLLVRLESALPTAPALPCTTSGGVVVAVGDQVLLLWMPEQFAYVCLGKVTLP